MIDLRQKSFEQELREWSALDYISILDKIAQVKSRHAEKKRQEVAVLGKGDPLFPDPIVLMEESWELKP